jgi:hypothetical protein
METASWTGKVFRSVDGTGGLPAGPVRRACPGHRGRAKSQSRLVAPCPGGSSAITLPAENWES